MTNFATFLEIARFEFPDLKLVRKSDSTFMKVINICLKIITFWQIKVFMTNYTTTINKTVYTHANWDTYTEEQKISVMRHELVHIRQQKRYGGRFIFSFLYMFIFPTVFTFRAKFEKEAYEETLCAYVDLYGVDSLDRVDKDAMISNFVGPNYFWMWPFKKSIQKWLDGAIEKTKAKYKEN